MHRLLSNASAIIITFLLIGPVVVASGSEQSISAAGPASAASSRLTTTPDGLSWTDDRRMTDDPAEDKTPSLAVNASGVSGLAWNRSGDFMWMKIDYLGNELMTEKTLVSGAFPTQYSGFCSPCIGVDSKGNYHIISSPGGAGAYYAKFSSSGGNLVSPYSVPQAAQSPHCPSLAVSSNDTVNIIYGDSRTGNPAITYARINATTGATEKDGIQISDPGLECEGSTIATDFLNSIHVTYLNSAQGCNHSMIDSQAKPIPEAPSTFLYTSGDFWTHAPASIGCDGPGNIHVVWNTAGYGTGTLMYMKLDNNGAKLSAGPAGTGIPLTAGPTCRGFPRVQGDSRGDAYVVWADVRNLPSQIYYVDILNGFENDSGLPGKAIDLNSNSFCTAVEPNIAVDPDDNIHVVWKDNRDGNLEIYYKYAYNHGVRLGMTDSERQKVMVLHPNETRTASISVDNTCWLDDTVDFNLTTDYHGLSGWNVFLNTQNISLTPKQSRAVRVSVTSPAMGNDGDFIAITVAAISGGNPKHGSSVTFQSHLVVNRGINLTCADSIHTTPPGITTQYRIWVMNAGEKCETIAFQASGLTGWHYSLDPVSIDFKAKESALTFLNVTPPSDAAADAVCVVNVTGATTSSPFLKASVIIQAIVAPVLSLELTPDRKEAVVEPGHTANYEIMVRAHGNIHYDLTFLLHAVHPLGSWNVSLDPPNLIMSGEDLQYVSLNVTAPQDALAGSSLAVRAECRDDTSIYSANCTTITTVLPVHGLHLDVGPASAAVLPGQTATFFVFVKNSGNGPEVIRLGTSNLDVGWESHYELEDGTPLPGNANITINPSETWGVVFQVVPAQDTLCGDHPLSGQLLDGEGTQLAFTVLVHMNQTYRTNVSAPANSVGEPGGILLVPMNISNDGNGQDTLTFTAPLLPSDWSIEFLGPAMNITDHLDMGPKTMAVMTVRVTVPANFTGKEALLHVRTRSNDGSNQTAIINISVKQVNLKISGLISSPQKPRSGQEVSINISIRNAGDRDVKNVTIVMEDENGLRKNSSLNMVSADSAQNLIFTWTARAGRHILTFKVDPANTIPETNESDNTFHLFVDVVEPPNGGTAPLRGLGWEIAAAIAVIIGLILAVGAFLHHWRKIK